jgi:hypothetical protein
MLSSAYSPTERATQMPLLGLLCGLALALLLWSAVGWAVWLLLD